jgi:hypothetical protein
MRFCLMITSVGRADDIRHLLIRRTSEHYRCLSSIISHSTVPGIVRFSTKDGTAAGSPSCSRLAATFGPP